MIHFSSFSECIKYILSCTLSVRVACFYNFRVVSQVIIVPKIWKVTTFLMKSPFGDQWSMSDAVEVKYMYLLGSWYKTKRRMYYLQTVSVCSYLWCTLRVHKCYNTITKIWKQSLLYLKRNKVGMNKNYQIM